MKIACLTVLSTIAVADVGPMEGDFHNHPPVKENLTLEDGLEDWFPELRLNPDDQKQIDSMKNADTNED
jgi:hypothetical protein